eukprot:4793511-Alexandrium_andersonii.AAC.1
MDARRETEQGRMACRAGQHKAGQRMAGHASVSSETFCKNNCQRCRTSWIHVSGSGSETSEAAEQRI